MKRRTALLAALAIASGVLVSAPLRAAMSPAPSVLQTVDSKGLKKALDAQHGKVVLLNIWATTCGPCVAEFPNLVKLADAYRAKGVVLFTVTMDEPEDKAKAAAFLKKQKASGPAFIRRSGNVDDFFNSVDRKWSGTMPTTYVFDKTGKMVGAPLSGPQTYAKFEAALKPALK